MNRGRLRRYAVRVVAAVSLCVGVAVVAGGIANAATVPVTVGKVLPAHQVTADETTWQ